MTDASGKTISDLIHAVEREATGDPFTRLRLLGGVLQAVVSAEPLVVADVASHAGISRQAVSKSYRSLGLLIAHLKSLPPAGAGFEELRGAREQIKRLEGNLAEASGQRDEALHHLQLALATLEAERLRSGKVLRGRFQPRD